MIKHIYKKDLFTMYVIITYLNPEDIKKYDFDDVYIDAQIMNYHMGEEKVKEFLHSRFSGVDNVELSCDSGEVVYGRFTTAKEDSEIPMLHWELEVYRTVDSI